MTKPGSGGSGADTGAPGEYLIVVRGRLSEKMSDQLGGMKIAVSKHLGEQPLTTLIGRLRDQAELRGVVETLYEHRLPIISIERLGD